MKWLVILAVALTGLAEAAPINGETFDLVERAATTQFATFDDLRVGSNVITPYKGLAFTNLSVQNRTTTGAITPQTLFNYAINTLGQPYAYPSTLTIAGTTATSFDLAEFYFACMNAQTKVAVKCQFTITGLNAFDSRHQGPNLITYAPAAGAAAAMMKVSPGFSAVRQAYTNIYSSDVAVEQTVSVLDSVRYTVYT